MRPFTPSLVALACALAPAASAQDTRIEFSKAKSGAKPSGATFGDGEWTVAEQSGKRVLIQQAANANPVYNVILFNEPAFADVELHTSFTAISGEIDQGGGPVWRAKDAKNYYICRYNPLEDNFRLYKVIDGKRTQLATIDVPADKRGAHEIRVVMKGDAIQCQLDGGYKLEATDGDLVAPGKTGLWTKADAKTSFTELVVSPPKT